MKITLRQADPFEPGAAALLKQSHALMESLFPPEDNFFLDIDALCMPEISFLVAENHTGILGTGALADHGHYGEIKSLFVSSKARGLGIGAALLQRLEQIARAKNHGALRLETGDKLSAAHRLYTQAGFVRRGPFGDYPDANSSLFMEKPLG